MRRLALPLLVFTAGLAAGAWLPPGRRAADFSTGAGRGLVGDTTVAASAPASGRAYSSDEEMLTAIMSAVAENEPLRRAHRLHDLLGRLASAELAVLFDRAVRLDDGERRSAVLDPLLARWAAIDPAAAATAVRPYRDRFRGKGRIDWDGADTTVSRAWMQAMPEPELAEALAAPHAPWATSTAWNAIQALTKGDPARKLELLSGLPAGQLRGSIAEDAIKALAEKDSAAAESYLDLLPEPRQRALLRADILGKLAERDPAAGLARLAELAPDLTPGVPGVGLVSKVLQAAAQKDVPAALAAADALPGELRSQALGAVLVTWAHEHAGEALEWAAANGVNVAGARSCQYVEGELSEWTGFLGFALYQDREKTLAWLRAQPASPEREAMLMGCTGIGTPEQRREIYDELAPAAQADAVWSVVNGFTKVDANGNSRIDTTAAETWVRSLPPGEARTAAVKSLVLSQASNAPENREALADAWPAGPEHDAALRAVAMNFTERDPRHALDLARNVADETERESTFIYIARFWLGRDEAAARAWLAGATELSAEEKRVIVREFERR